MAEAGVVHILWRNGPRELVAVFSSLHAANRALQAGRGTFITSHWLADRG